MTTEQTIQAEIRELETRLVEIRNKIAELRIQEDDIEETVKALRGQDFLQTTDQHLQQVVWEPISVTPRGIVLTAKELSNVVDDRIHNVLGLSFHGGAELEDGVSLRVDDEEMRLFIDTPKRLLDFASNYHLNIRWGKFRDMLTDARAWASKSVTFELELGDIIEALKIPEDAK